MDRLGECTSERARRHRGIGTLLTSERYVVRGESMRPALEPGDHLLVGRATFDDSDNSRGGVVVVLDPHDNARRSLKRIVGLPGEQVRFLDGVLFLNGARTEEPYLAGLPSTLGLGDRTWDLGASEYFVLGDTRHRSTDSRDYGPVSTELMVGKVWLRYWPPHRWGRVG